MSERRTVPIAAPVSLAKGDGKRSRILVAKFGRFQDSRYGRFAITAEMARKWERNLREAFNSEIAVDLDHSPEKQGKTEAAGWIKGLEIADDGVYADVEWTSLGVEKVSERRYRYISPTFVDNFKNEKGKSLGPALIGVALTNRPFLRDMPAVSLSREEALEVIAQVAGELGLAEDASHEDVVEGLKLLAEPLADPEPPETFHGVPDVTADVRKFLDDLHADGHRTLDQPPGGGAPEPPEGVDPASFALDARAQTYMAEHEVDYVTALDAVAADPEPLKDPPAGEPTRQASGDDLALTLDQLYEDRERLDRVYQVVQLQRPGLSYADAIEAVDGWFVSAGEHSDAATLADAARAGRIDAEQLGRDLDELERREAAAEEERVVALGLDLEEPADLELDAAGNVLIDLDAAAQLLADPVAVERAYLRACQLGIATVGEAGRTEFEAELRLWAESGRDYLETYEHELRAAQRTGARQIARQQAERWLRPERRRRAEQRDALERFDQALDRVRKLAR